MSLVLLVIRVSGTPVWVTGIGETDVAIGVLDVSGFLELAGKQGTKSFGVGAIDGLHKLLLGEGAIAVGQQGKDGTRLLALDLLLDSFVVLFVGGRNVPRIGF